MCLSQNEGGQEKEDQWQQIPTFRCSELSILKICIAKILLLSPHGTMWLALTCLQNAYSESLMAPMMHPRHQPLNGKGYMFRCGGDCMHQITPLEIKGGARAS